MAARFTKPSGGWAAIGGPLIPPKILEPIGRETLELAGRSQLRWTTLPNPAGTLHLCHRHVFRSHHHRDATAESVGRKLVYSVTPCGASFSANEFVFELRTISYEIGR